MSTEPSATYIHGTAPEEQQRLAALNALTNRDFLAFVRVARTDAVLEVGSGLGILAAEVARRVPFGEVVGLEHSAAQLERADGTVPNLSFVQGDAHALPFPDGRFDVAYARYVLEHVADPARVLAEVHRVLRPGGRVFLQENDILVSRLDPPCPAFDRVWERFAELQRALGGDALIGRALFRLVRAAGFRDVTPSVQPEVHWAGTPSFVPWITNLIGNVRGGAEALEARGLATAREVDAAVAELDALRASDDGCAWFYWNRAEATR